MLRNLMILPDGTALFSGADQANAIQSVTLTQCVNSDEDLTLGSVCANMMEATILTPGGGLSLGAGDEVVLYQVDGDGQRRQVGIFILEKPTRPTANTMKLVGYDRIVKLDRDLTGWLAGLAVWPYSLLDFAHMVCTACGLELKNEGIPNGDFQVLAFSGEGITGRQIMQWIGQAAGRFCRAAADGQVELGWYENSGVQISPGGQVYYFQNGLQYEDYRVSPVEKVQIRLTDSDVGTVYPDTAGEVNTYIISGNYLLTAADPLALKPVAQTLYEQLRNVSYTPCKVELPGDIEVCPGQIVTIVDRNGKSITAYVMTKVRSGQRITLECTGSPRRDSTTAVNNQSYSALSGRVMELRTDVEGLRAENRDAAGRTASLELTVEGINARVSGQMWDADGLKKQITALEQTADAVKISVQSIRDNGVSKVSNEFGLAMEESAVTIHRSGSEMTNTLNEEGMYVVRSKGTSKETVMLQADAKGVTAADVTVRNYLVVGDHARFEDYNNGTDSRRTACFWVGG